VNYQIERELLMGKQSAVVVLGMGRSGSSLCTSVLRALGVFLGDKLVPGDQYNEPGYFEDYQIWHVHERVLATLNRSWDTLSTIRPLPPQWWQSKLVERLQAELTEIVRTRIASAGGKIWGFKDPRTAHLMPLWGRVFQDLDISPVFVLCVRHPGAVAQSLATRDGFPLHFTELLWFETTLIACLVVQGARHCLVHFEDWLYDPWRSAEMLAETIGVDMSADRDELRATLSVIIKTSLRHDIEDSAKLHSRPAAELYDCLLHRSQAPERETLQRFEVALEASREFIAVVEELAGRDLPHSVSAPPYDHFTDEDLTFMESDKSSAKGPSRNRIARLDPDFIHRPEERS
jgi:hypothetical protein